MVYENAPAHKPRKAGLAVVEHHPLTDLYDGVVVGDYIVDLMVERSIVVELKAVSAMDEMHHAQCLNYLRTSGLRLRLLPDFGLWRPKIKRVVNGL